MIRRRLLESLVTSAFLVALGTPLCSRAVQSKATSPEQDSSVSTLHASSRLVLIPVFVFRQDRFQWAWDSFPEARACADEDYRNFLSLSASEPYLAKVCDPDLVQNLAPSDFHLFIDGSERKIETVTAEQSWITVRDNVATHLDSSDTASGTWSSDDFPTGAWRAGDQSRHFRPSTRSYYSVAFAPPGAESGCHRIKVKIDRPGLYVFARDKYCDGQSADDPLYGNKLDEVLSADLSSAEKPQLALSLQTAVAHLNRRDATLDVVLNFPWKELDHQWDTDSWKLIARIAVVGVVYDRNGVFITRFSDLLYPSWWPTFGAKYSRQSSQAGAALETGDTPTEADRELTAKYLSRWDPIWLPTRYETQVDLAPGDYLLKVVLSDGKKIGRAEAPLDVEAYDGKQLAISGVMVGKRFRHAHVAAIEAEAANIAPQYVPLVSKDVRLTPAGDTRFFRGDPLITYFELYEPSLKAPKNATPPGVQVHMRIINSGGIIVKDFPAFDVSTYEREGSEVIPIAREVPFNLLPSGGYKLQVQGTDSAGRTTPWRTADFSIE